MNYRLKSNRRPNGRTRFVKVALFLLIVVLVIFPGILFTVSITVAKGSLSVRDRLVSGYDISLSYFTARNHLVRENEHLRNIALEIDGYRALNSVLQRENNILKDIDAEKEDEDSVAQVLKLPPQTPFDVMIIESNDIFTEGYQVLSKSGILVGTVIEKVGQSAKVKLLSSAKNTFFVENARTGERYETVGRSSGNYFTRLPKETDIEKDDILVMRSEEFVHPVSIVGSIEVRESSPFLTAFSASPVSLFSLQHVVLKKPYEKEE